MTAENIDLGALRLQIEGDAFARGDDGYGEAVSGFNTVAPISPDAVVVPLTERDVAAAVQYARELGLRLSVMCTGHGSYAPITGGLLIRTNRLLSVDVDPTTAVARLGAGVVWRDALPVFAEHGLTAITGSSPTVGAIGLALGGGMGPLSRTYGYTADWVTAFRMVRADGDVVVADATENPELFWALRGGKGGLGIVTEMSIQLLDLPTVYGGGLFWVGDDIEPVYRAWAAWAERRPDSVNSSVNLLRLPDVPGVHEALRGRAALHLRYVYSELGCNDEQLRRRGEAELASIRAVAAPVLDTVEILPSAHIGSVHADPDGPLPIWERGMLLDNIDERFVDALLGEVGGGVDAPFIAVEVRCLGGRIRSGLGTSIGGRSAPYSLLLIGTPIVELFDLVIPDAADSLVDALGEWVLPSNTYNWAGHPATPEAFAACWDEATHARLSQLRRAHDPTRLFAFGPA